MSLQLPLQSNNLKFPTSFSEDASGGASHPMNGLDGITMLRYAHISRERTAGGAEQYLGQVNGGLLARNRITIVQTHLVDGSTKPSKPEIEFRGRGRIIWIPVPIYSEKQSLFSVPRRLRRLVPRPGSAAERSGQFEIAAAYRLIRASLSNSCGHLRHATMIVSDFLPEVLDTYHVNLVLLHWLSYDVGTLVSSCVTRGIPFGIINHFDNRRLDFPRMRPWAQCATALGGVSDRNVPSHISPRYVNLSDAIDVNFFSPTAVNGSAGSDERVILLPARLTEDKGHHDLLQAARLLSEAGLHSSVVFAGAVESDGLQGDLERQAAHWNIRVHFLGQLSADDLRSWYQRSDVVVLPSRSEGLGRVLLEAQAMKKPVVAYDCGGIPDALLPDRTGYLVPTGDYDALANRLMKLLTDRALRDAMGEAGRQYVADHFSPARLVERHERFYSTILANTFIEKSGQSWNS